MIVHLPVSWRWVRELKLVMSHLCTALSTWPRGSFLRLNLGNDSLTCCTSSKKVRISLRMERLPGATSRLYKLVRGRTQAVLMNFKLVGLRLLCIADKKMYVFLIALKVYPLLSSIGREYSLINNFVLLELYVCRTKLEWAPSGTFWGTQSLFPGKLERWSRERSAGTHGGLGVGTVCSGGEHSTRCTFSVLALSHRRVARQPRRGLKSLGEDPGILTRQRDLFRHHIALCASGCER